MGTPNLTNFKVELPSGITATIAVPSELDPKLVELALRLFAGSFVAVMKATDPGDQRDFLIRLVASIANTADTTIRSAQMANKLHSSSKTAIIDDLLKSLH